MNKYRQTLEISWKVAFASLLALSPALYAQEEKVDTEVFKLESFTVDSSDDEGYRAKNTLSGSRMKMALDDIAIPMDIITAEVLEDFAVDTVDDLFDIVSNLEPRGDNDQFVANVYDSGSSYRIRGFDSWLGLRNFVKTVVPFESYNSSRMVASKGPNSILYGSGESGGSVGYFTKRYQFGGRDRTGVSLRLDSFGSYRANMNLSRTLVKDKLGVFFATYNQDKKFELKPSYVDGSGYYLNVSAKPFKNTSVSLSLETRTEDNFRGGDSYTNLMDYHSPWQEFGSPALLGETGGEDGYVSKGSLVSVNVGNSGIQLDEQVLSDWGLGRVGGARHTLIDGEIVSTLDWGITSRATKANSPGGNQSQLTKDYNKGFIITGSNSGASIDYDAIDLNIEQQIGDNLFLIAAFGKSTQDRTMYTMRTRNLYVDPNYYLPGSDDGSGGLLLNPHFGEYYAELGPYNNIHRESEAETVTLTAAYDLDLTETNEWLGHHKIATLWSNGVTTTRNDRTRMVMTQSPDGPVDQNVSLTSANLGLVIREYIDPFAGEHLDDYTYIKKQGYYENGAYRWEDVEAAGGYGLFDQDVTSQMGVLNSYWLNRRLITNIGYRIEEVDTHQLFFGRDYTLGGQFRAFEFYTEEDFLTGKVTKKNRKVTDVIGPDATLPSTPYATNEGFSRNIGAIYKVSPSIAIFANKANNIDPAARSVGVTGQYNPMKSGESFDYGFRLNLFHNRVRFEYNRYDTTKKNDAQTATGNRIRVPFSNTRYMFGALVEAGVVDENPFIDGTNRDIRDSNSSGHEINVSTSFSNGFSSRLAVSYNYNIGNNLGGQFMPIWEANKEKFAQFAEENPDYVWYEDPATEGTQIATFAEQYESALNMLDLRSSIEGLPNANQSSWQAKLLSKYAFRDGSLKGNSIGVNVVWRDGYISGLYRNADNTFDADRPYTTKDTWNTNVFWKYSREIKVAGNDMKWSLQFNVNNLFDSYTEIERGYFNEAGLDEVYSNQIKRANGRSYSMTNSFAF